MCCILMITIVLVIFDSAMWYSKTMPLYYINVMRLYLIQAMIVIVGILCKIRLLWIL